MLGARVSPRASASAANGVSCYCLYLDEFRRLCNTRRVKPRTSPPLPPPAFTLFPLLHLSATAACTHTMWYHYGIMWYHVVSCVLVLRVPRKHASAAGNKRHESGGRSSCECDRRWWPLDRSCRARPALPQSERLSAREQAPSQTNSGARQKKHEQTRSVFMA